MEIPSTIIREKWLFVVRPICVHFINYVPVRQVTQNLCPEKRRSTKKEDGQPYNPMLFLIFVDETTH